MAESAITEITMPEMGESVTEGTVLEWHVAVGDAVEEGQTIVEVSTDKVDAEVPAPTSGTITSLAVEVDDEVAIGAVLAEIDPSGAPVSAGDSTEAEKAEAAPTEEGDADLGEPETPVASSTPKADDSASTGESITVTMPEMGESVTEGTVLEWHVAVGDKVDEGQTLIEVSTDKVDAEVPAPTSGTITKLLVEPDDEIPIGAGLAELDPSGTAAATDDSAPAEAGNAEATPNKGQVDIGEGRATPV
ncbi:MAG: biotin/lipoyl-containing protein, partial [Solirubrobacterales bacterium]